MHVEKMENISWGYMTKKSKKIMKNAIIKNMTSTFFLTNNHIEDLDFFTVLTHKS